LSVRTTKIRQIFNLAVPANEFVNLAELMTEGDIEDYRDILRDGPRRDAFHEFHWLPTRQGALLRTLPVHDSNDLFDTTFRLFSLQSPLLMGKTQRAIALLSDQRFVDLNTNLHYFERRYDVILAGRDEWRDTMTSVRGTRFRRVESLYYDYICSQSAEVRSMLDRIAAMPVNSPDEANDQVPARGKASQVSAFMIDALPEETAGPSGRISASSLLRSCWLSACHVTLVRSRAWRGRSRLR
jgi:hypothetical protein